VFCTYIWRNSLCFFSRTDINAYKLRSGKATYLMRILFDATAIVQYKTGMSNYIANILQNICNLYPGHEYTAIVNPNFHDSNMLHPKINIFSRRIGPIGIMRDVVYYTIRKQIMRDYDIFHCLSEQWPRCLKRGICTIHDLRFRQKDSYGGLSWLKRKYFKNLIGGAVRNADKIIAVSQSTKSDIIDIFGDEYSGKIEIVYHGLERQISKGGDWDTLAIKYNIKGPYVLSVGEIRRHKNFHTLISAFKIFKKRYDKWNTKLVIAGKERDKSLISKMRNIAGSDIVLTGHVPQSELTALYSNSRLFVLISIAEGFGFPVLEAMNHNVPVICSNISALDEIAANAAVKVDPCNYEDIAEKIYKLLNDEGLRMALIAKGMERLKQFSWDKAAKKLMCVYKNLYFNKKYGFRSNPYI